jgi:hypothetical protein
MSRSDHRMTDGLCAPITGLRPRTRPMARGKDSAAGDAPGSARRSGQSPEARCGAGPGFARSRAGAVPDRSRISRTPLPGPFPVPDDPHQRGRERTGGCDSGGGRGYKCERKVNAHRQPLDSKRPTSCPTVGSAIFPPRSPRPRPPRPPESRRNRQRLPQHIRHKSHPMTFWAIAPARRFRPLTLPPLAHILPRHPCGGPE